MGKGIEMRAVVFLAICVLLGGSNTGAAATIDQGTRSVSTDSLSVRWSADDPEQIDALLFGGRSMTNIGAPPRQLPPGCHFEEYFGNSWTRPEQHFPFMLVGDSVGRWTNPGDSRIAITSMSPCSFGGTGVDVQTTYKFFDHGPAANKFRVERRFAFGETSANYDIRPYIPRLYPRTSFRQVLHPDATGTHLVVDSIDSCEFGCRKDDWNGTWFASHDATTGRGMI
jgi:hypothetical protein